MPIRHDIPLDAEMDSLVPPKPRGTPERDFQRVAIRWLRTVLPAGSLAAIVVNEQRGAGTTARQRQRFGMARKASGVVTGFPDIVVAVSWGPVLFVELKTPKGIISEAQQRVHAQLRAVGHTVIIADSIESLRHGLLKAGIATRETPGQPMREASVKLAKSRVPADRIPF